MTKMEIINNIVGTFNELCNANRYSYPDGNLMYNALNYQITETHVIVYLDTKVASYVPYTNDSGRSKQRESKKISDNGWWENFCEEFANRLAEKLRGEITL